MVSTKFIPHLPENLQEKLQTDPQFFPRSSQVISHGFTSTTMQQSDSLHSVSPLSLH